MNSGNTDLTNATIGRTLSTELSATASDDYLSFNLRVRKKVQHKFFKTPTYTIMLLIGMWMSLTKKPMNPMIAKPIAVAMAIF